VNMMLLLLLYIKLSLVLIHVSTQSEIQDAMTERAFIAEIKKLTQDINKLIKLSNLPKEITEYTESMIPLTINITKLGGINQITPYIAYYRNIYHITYEISKLKDIYNLTNEIGHIKSVCTAIPYIWKLQLQIIQLTLTKGSKSKIQDAMIERAFIADSTKLEMKGLFENIKQLKERAAKIITEVATKISEFNELYVIPQEIRQFKGSFLSDINQLTQNTSQLIYIYKLTENLSQLKGRILERQPKIRRLNQNVVEKTDMFNKHLANYNQTIDEYVECEHKSIRSVLGMNVMQDVRTFLESRFVQNSKYYRNASEAWDKCVGELDKKFNGM
ncbi:hypothetical protein MN116_000255, partial [Schistosoma mekongi]